MILRFYLITDPPKLVKTVADAKRIPRPEDIYIIDGIKYTIIDRVFEYGEQDAEMCNLSVGLL